MKHLLLVCLYLLISFPAFSQQDSTKQQDQSVSPLIRKLKKIAADGAIKSRQEFKDEKTANRQRIVLEYARDLNRQAKLLLKKGIDTNNLNAFLQDTKKSLEIVKDGIWIHAGSNQTQRNLTVSSNILTELSTRVAKKKQFLDSYATKLTSIKFRIDSLSNEPSLYAFPSDSVDLIKFFKRMFVTVKEMAPIDSALAHTTASLEELQLKTDFLAFEIRSAQEDIDIYSNKLSANTFNREFPNLWDKPANSRPLQEILSFSMAKESLLLEFYLENHGLSLFLLIVLTGCSWSFLRSLKHQLRQENLLNNDYTEQL